VSSDKSTKDVLLNHDSDLVLLSACAEPDPLMRCLGGELRIFMMRWLALVDRVRKLAKQGDYDAAYTLLKSGDDVYTALNSGAMKYRWFVEGEFSKTVQRVRRLRKGHRHVGRAFRRLGSPVARHPKVG